MTSVFGAPDLLLPEGSTLLHVGPPKTGTTTLQYVFHRRREKVAEHGVAYPGLTPKPRAPIAAMMGWEPPTPLSRRQGEVFERELAASSDLRTCVSLEMMARASDDEAATLVRRLGGARPHVVLSTRRYDKLLPSRWHQWVKASTVPNYSEFLDQVLSDRPSARKRNTWYGHETAQQAERWAAAAGGLENVTVLIPGDDRAALPTAFESLLGLPAGLLTPSDDEMRNVSMSYREVEVLRRWRDIWIGLTDDRDLRERYVRAAGNILVTGERPARDSRYPAVPRRYQQALDERSELRIQQLAGLQQQGLRVVGDLESLRIPDSAYSDADLAPVQEFTADEVAQLLQAIAQVVVVEDERRTARHAAALAELRRQLAAAQARPAPSLKRRVQHRAAAATRKVKRRLLIR